MKREITGYADRLRVAMEQGPRPMGARPLAKELQRRFPGMRGTSYGGVRQYAEGKVISPRIELLRALADVLEVRADWLAFGEGEMTEDADLRRKALEDKLEADEMWDWLSARIGHSFPEYASMRPAAKALVLEAIDRFMNAAESPLYRDDGRLDPVAYDSFLMWLRGHVFSSFVAWRWGDSPNVQSKEIQDYILSALVTAIQVIPESTAVPPADVYLREEEANDE